jgi:glyoxylase-like metal-dependent hydrolase (beta-lactamase superfamily II)
MRVNRQVALVGSMQFGLSSEWDCHVYAIRAPEGVVLVDSGSGMASETIVRNVGEDLGTDRVAAVVLTHAHADHAAGAASLRERTGCALLVPQPSRRIVEQGDEEAAGLRLAREQGGYPAEVRLRPVQVDAAFGDGEFFEAGGLRFRAIHVRGHSEDSTCLECELECGRALFCGDVVFYGGVLGVINAAGSGLEGYRCDLGKLRGLAVQALFPGHGLFTLKRGQRHIDAALAALEGGFLPRMVGQFDRIF